MATRIETCSADRRTQIEYAMQGRGQNITKITLQGDEVDAQKQQALAQKIKHIEDFKQSLNNHT